MPAEGALTSRFVDFQFSEDQDALRDAVRSFLVSEAPSTYVRAMADDELETTWFQRHGSTPTTEIPAHWPVAYRKLVEASIDHKLESLDEALKVLKYQRETWAMLMESLAKQKAAAAAQKLDIPSPDPKMEASISMQG